MFKTVHDNVWAFDAEWVPDPDAGRALYGCSDEMSDLEVMEEMWKEKGATEDNPRPFLKLSVSRLVSIAMVMRQRRPNGEVDLALRSQPGKPYRGEGCREADILSKFLISVGMRRPQLVGFNSTGSDLPIMVQRGVIKGIQAEGYCKRSVKPWGPGPDYFGKGNEYNIDLMESIGAWGRATPSLNEIATLSGIPSKLENYHGTDVTNSWLEGDIERIVQYNECDALTTYLVWLRIAHFAGFFDPRQYREEQDLLRSNLEDWAQSPGREHLSKFIDKWDRLRQTAGDD